MRALGHSRQHSGARLRLRIGKRLARTSVKMGVGCGGARGWMEEAFETENWRRTWRQ